MRVYLEQLERLAGLGARLALPAHGDPIDEPTALFRRYIKHRGMREAKTLASLPATIDEGRTLEELVPIAYDDTPMRMWPIARLSLASHLAKLAEEGRAIERDGRWARSSPCPRAPCHEPTLGGRLRRREHRARGADGGGGRERSASDGMRRAPASSSRALQSRDEGRRARRRSRRRWPRSRRISSEMELQ